MKLLKLLCLLLISTSNIIAEETELFSKTLQNGEVFSCYSDVFYHWKIEEDETTEKNIEKNTEKTATKKSVNEKNKELSTDNSSLKQVDEIKEFYTTLVEQNQKGIEAKKILERRLNEAKSQALSACRLKHSAASCETGKIQANISRMQLLDFETKRAFQKSISESCKEIAGNCLHASNSDISCEIYSSPDIPLKVEVKEAETPTKSKK